VGSNLSGVTIQEAYNLSHPAFELDPFEDSAIYFGREVLLSKVLDYAKMSKRQQKPLKLVIEGSWGFGKTHTLNHLVVNKYMRELADGVYVFLPDLSGKENPFEGFFYYVLRSLLKSGHLRQFSRAVRDRRDLAEVLKKEAGSFVYSAIYGLTNPELGAMVERWLTGERLLKSELKDSGLSEQMRTEEARELLSSLGQFSLEEKKKMLLLLLDEAHRLQNITKESPKFHEWSTEFKLLLDAHNKLGMVLAMGEREAPVTLLEMPEDRSRLGYRWETMKMLEDQNLEEFLSKLIRYVRDGWDIAKDAPNEPTKLIQDFVKQWNESQSEKTDAKFYPFTERAFRRLVDTLKRAAPRDLCKAIDDVTSLDEVVRRRIILESDVERIIAIVRELDKVRRPLKPGP